MALDKYADKRDFSKTPEPSGSDLEIPTAKSRFVIQRHKARRLHYDLRLEMEGVLKSWAVPKGPSMNPKDKRLSIHTEDHPIEYLKFEGIIPKGNYGAGSMAIWDEGTFRLAPGSKGDLSDQYSRGDLKLEFFGTKLLGNFALVHTRGGEKNDQWLLIKKEDEFATGLAYDAEEWLETKDESSTRSSGLDIRRMVSPMLAGKTTSIFSKAGWIFEIKWDGYRILANIHNGKAEIYSRNGISYNQHFRSLHQNLSGIPHDVVLDGEVVIVDEEGKPDFQKLQHYAETGEGELRYYVFDMLFLNGHDITHLPLLERKSLIKEVIEGIPLVYYCDHIESLGNAFYEQAVSSGLEGVMAKKADSTYDIGRRTENWLKIKSVESQEALIAGYTESDGRHFGSLILAVYESGKLAYVGNCGTGFDDQTQKELWEKFQPLKRDKSPFDEKINLKGRKPHWLEPLLIVEVKFANWTKSGMMRHPSFKGIRTDKLAREIHPVESVESASGSKNKHSKSEILEIDGFEVPISNLDKVYWPDSGITKFQLLDYYLSISEYILPFLKDRPQNMHRHPDGIDAPSFYHKDTAGIFPPWIETVQIYSSSSEKDIEYLICQHEATLLYMANLGCIEINPWNSRIESLENPDYGIIDLDPSPKTTFEEVIEVAQMAYEILQKGKIDAYCKTSGSKGLHIYVPFSAKYAYEDVRDFIKVLCYLVEEKLPALCTMERTIDKRGGKIYLDYLQNRKGQTLAAPYCVRPKPGATVSAPLEWKEVKAGLDMRDFTIFTMPERIKAMPNLFLGVLGDGIKIEEALENLMPLKDE
ncbi:DNA ligase D [Lunatibacter salilacus]|uniref:DNA ligase D n=1 Tax=Lunatibacter salilacus TaxID=2483804 RepID=UPI00131D07E3|nr:DNA ligase D [Lunatibacter salilacus]